MAVGKQTRQGKPGRRWIGTLAVALSSLARSHSLLVPTPTDRQSLHDALTRPSRRRVLQTIGIATPLISVVQASRAAPPVTQQETESATARLFRAVRPKPSRSLRNKLNLDFAVLLMRSSYNALDQLDCVPMDQFQRDFFLIRQAEYKPYVDALGPGIVQQGDLTDPYYFDFISFAQYQTINREITMDPPSVFVEKQPIQAPNDDATAPQQFAETIVKRDPAITNDMLAMEHGRRVGASIIDRFEDLYGNTPIALPQQQFGSEIIADSENLDKLLSQLVKLFVINGFAWDGSTTRTSATGSPTASFVLSLQSPATLWAGQGLVLEQSRLRNDFLLKAANELLTRRGYRITGSSCKYEGANEVTRLSVSLS